MGYDSMAQRLENLEEQLFESASHIKDLMSKYVFSFVLTEWVPLYC